MQFKVVSDISECKRLWHKFWRGDELFDDWEYRACFYDPSEHELHFIVGIENGEDVGMLPLWKYSKNDYYEWFGGEFPEHNRFPANRLDLFLEQVPVGAWLPYAETIYSKHVPLSEDEGSFYINLEKYNHDLEQYLATFSKKHRKNLRYDLSKLGEVQVVHNDLEDFDDMARLSMERFDDSFFSDLVFRQGFRKLLDEAKRRGELEMISLRIDGKTEACEAAILHKGTYTVMLGGSNQEISNIGKLLAMEHIKNAISKKAKIIDFLAHDSGWKRLWNMEERKWCEII